MLFGGCRAWAGRSTVLLAISIVVGCSRSGTDPTDTGGNNRHGIALPAVGGARLNPALAGGQAEWIAFREPTAPDDESGDTAGADSAKPVSDSPGGVSDVRALVEEYNGAVADGDVDGLLEYFVVEQEDALRPVVIAALAVSGQVTKFCEGAVPTVEGAEAERFRELCKQATQLFHPRLAVDDYQPIEAGGVSMRVTSRVFPAEVSAVQVEGDWYFRIADAAGLGNLPARLDALATQLEQWSEGLKSGGITLADTLSALEQAVSAEPKPEPTEAEPSPSGG